MNENPKILAPAAGGAVTAAACALALMVGIDAFSPELWPVGFSGQTLLPQAMGLIMTFSFFAGFPVGAVMALVASGAFPAPSFFWKTPMPCLMGAATGLFLVYGLALGMWPWKLVRGDLFILVAALSLSAGGTICALLLARSCRAVPDDSR